MNRPSLFKHLLPNEAVVTEARGSSIHNSNHTNPSDQTIWEEGLRPAEKVIATHFAPKRLQEFTAGRNCARAALRELGYPNSSILTNSQRAPLFPYGIIGSLTHTQYTLKTSRKQADNDLIERYCASVLIDQAKNDQYLSIGIDAEENSPLEQALHHIVINENEKLHIDSLIDHHRPRPGTDINSTPAQANWSKIAFSAKESFYKAFYPLIFSYLDFLDAEITLVPYPNLPRSGEFFIKIIKPPNQKDSGSEPLCPNLYQLIYTGNHKGKYEWDENLIYTAITLSR